MSEWTLFPPGLDDTEFHELWNKRCSSIIFGGLDLFETLRFLVWKNYVWMGKWVDTSIWKGKDWNWGIYMYSIVHRCIYILYLTIANWKRVSFYVPLTGGFQSSNMLKSTYVSMLVRPITYEQILLLVFSSLMTHLFISSRASRNIAGSLSTLPSRHILLQGVTRLRCAYLKAKVSSAFSSSVFFPVGPVVWINNSTDFFIHLKTFSLTGQIVFSNIWSISADQLECFFLAFHFLARVRNVFFLSDELRKRMRGRDLYRLMKLGIVCCKMVFDAWYCW